MINLIQETCQTQPQVPADLLWAEQSANLPSPESPWEIQKGCYQPSLAVPISEGSGPQVAHGTNNTIPAHAGDSPADHQLLDLFGAFEDVVGPSELSVRCRRVARSLVW